jgi:hypothetical protein
MTATVDLEVCEGFATRVFLARFWGCRQFGENHVGNSSFYCYGEAHHGVNGSLEVLYTAVTTFAKWQFSNLATPLGGSAKKAIQGITVDNTRWATHLL